MVALLFPGQGSQVGGMGRDLSDAFPLARRTFEEADDALGVNLSRIMWEGPEAELTATVNAQPALLTHSIATYRVLADELGEATHAAGHSLGEFSAHVAAGTIAFNDAVRAVRRRGELMQRSGEERPGTMAALIGLDDDVADSVCREASDEDTVVVPANYNSPGQIVISGDVAAIERAMTGAKEAGAKRALPLNVSGAFHSPLMGVAEAGLREFLHSIPFQAPRILVVSNVTAQPVSDPDEARRLLVSQLTSPVRWADSMRTLVGLGATRFIELGPGNVLSGLMRRIDKGVAAESVGTAEAVQAFTAEAREA